jgi:hypothetical protein
MTTKGFIAGGLNPQPITRSYIMAVISRSAPFRHVGLSTGARSALGYLLMAVAAMVIGVGGAILTVGGL